MVPPKAEVRTHDADEGAEEDVEAVVAEVGVAGRADVDGGADGDEGDDEGVGWGRRGLVAQRDGCRGGGGGGAVWGEGWGVGGGFGGGVLVVGGEDAVGEVGGGLEDGGVGGVGVGREEGDGDGEFGAEEEG